MDQIKKFIRKLSKKQAQKIQQILIEITLLKLENYDIKKIKGKENLYRLRTGEIRIVFLKKEEKGVIIDINYRGSIYK